MIPVLCVMPLQLGAWRPRNWAGFAGRDVMNDGGRDESLRPGQLPPATVPACLSFLPFPPKKASITLLTAGPTPRMA